MIKSVAMTVMPELSSLSTIFNLGSIEIAFSLHQSSSLCMRSDILSLFARL